MSNITGAWRNEEATIVFGGDALILGERRFSCERDGDQLFIAPGEARMVIPYRCEGDTLRLDVDGVVSVWTRVVDV